MPVQFFTEAERAQRDRFPEVITSEDLVIFFTLSRMVKKLMRLRMCSISAAPQAVRDTASGLWAPCPG